MLPGLWPSIHTGRANIPSGPPIDREPEAARGGCNSTALGKHPSAKGYLYEVYVNSTDPDVEAQWTLLDQSSPASYKASGLEAAKHYWFRVLAVGAFKGTSPFSDPAKGFSAPLP